MISKNKYRNGSVSMIAVIFGTLVMSLICMSFIQQMRSGLSQNVAHTTSMAAYDAALTGVNDTQLAVGECRRNPGVPGSERAGACRRILEGNMNCRESMRDIQYVIWGGTFINDLNDIRIGLIDENNNQRYTCITIEATTTSYQGVLSPGYSDGVIIPLATVGNARYALVSYGVNMSAPSSSNISSTANNVSPFGYDTSLINRANEQRSAKNFKDSTTRNSDFPTLGFEISQTAANFKINDLSDNDSNTTNTGYLMLAPSSKITTRQTIKNGDSSVNGKNILVGLAGSADKANQAPSSVSCKATASGYNAVNGSQKYNCSTLIELPNPRGGSERDKDHSFIRLTLPFVEPSNGIRFEVSFYDNSAATNPLILNETQYRVSVQGHTGDRIRRVNAYLGGMSSSAIVPMWSASVGGTAGVSKCTNGSCDTNNNATSNRLQYTTTYTLRDLSLTCKFTYATKDASGKTDLNIPTPGQMNAHCASRFYAEMESFRGVN